MTRTLRALAALALAGAIAGCSGDDPASRTDAGDDLSRPQQRLAELAGLAAAASYDATYGFTAASGEQGTIRIVAAPPSYRVDVSLGGAPSTFIQHEGSVVSCTRKQATPTCLLVARPGEPVPELFDPGVQRLFSDAVADLAANPERYQVDEASPAGSPTASPGECFAVRRLPPPASGSPTAPPPAAPTGFETGEYCFGDDGVLTALRVSTGTLVLRTRGATPGAKAFVPPAPPAALPDLPSGSPTR